MCKRSAFIRVHDKLSHTKPSSLCSSVSASATTDSWFQVDKITRSSATKKKSLIKRFILFTHFYWISVQNHRFQLVLNQHGPWYVKLHLTDGGLFQQQFIIGNFLVTVEINSLTVVWLMCRLVSVLSQTRKHYSVMYNCERTVCFCSSTRSTAHSHK